MKKLILLLLLQATAAKAQVPINAILNTATPQNAQFNVGTGTVRGTLTVGSLITSNLTVGALTVTSIAGSGAGLTNLPSAQLTGTIASGRLAGAYTGITQIGTISAGTWHGDVLGTQYGGTGQNFVNVSTGDILYFNGAGSMAALTPGAPQQLLQSNGFAAPGWTGSPTINGQNIQNLQPTYIATGTIPSYVKVDDPSILAVSASKVAGNISGNSAGISGFLPLYKLSTGTLNANIVASSITGTGVLSGVYGSSNTSVQMTIGSDGRIRTAASLPIPGVGPNTARTDIDNGFTAPQTIRLSSFTVGGNGLFFGTVTASNFIGDGSQLTNINAANVNGIVNGTGTANQFSYFSGMRTLASTGAFTLNGTTLRVGNLNTQTPTADVHLIVGGGARAYNLNLGEDPINLEIAGSQGTQAAIGLSINGIQQVHFGETNHHNFVMYDDAIGGGLGTFFKESAGTGHVSFFNPESGETGIATPTELGLYGVMTFFGTTAIQPPSSASNATIYYNSGPNHYQFSENSNSYVFMPGLVATGFSGSIPFFTSNGGTYLTSDVNFSTTSVRASFDAIGTSTASLDVRLTSAEGSIASLKTSTSSLQTQIDFHSGQIVQLQNQDQQIALSTAIIAFSTGTLQAQVFGLFVSTGILQANDAALSASTFSLQTQINNIVVSSASLQAQVAALNLSTAALHAIDLSVGTSTGSLQSQVTANGVVLGVLGVSTNSLQVQLVSIGVSTASLQIQITALGASTQTVFNALEGQIVSLGASTNTIQTNVGASTAALHTVDIAVGLSTSNLQIGLNNVAIATATIATSTGNLQFAQGLIGVSTAAIQIGLNNVAIATATIATSTGNLQAQLLLVGVSTASLQAQINSIDVDTVSIAASTTSLQSQLTNVGASTAALQISLNNVAIATATVATSTGNLQVQITNVGASTAALQVQLTNVGVATNTLNQVKASTGTNNDITDLDALNSIAGPFTVDVGSVTAKFAILSLSSVTASHFGNGSGLTAIHNSSCTSIPNTTFTNASFGPAISTITISNIRAGSLVRVTFSGQAANNTSADGVGVTILQDGAFTTAIGNAAVAGFNNITAGLGTTVSTGENISFSVVLDTPTLSAGSHSWAFAPNIVTGGTGTLIKTAAVNNRFCVTEEP